MMLIGCQVYVLSQGQYVPIYKHVNNTDCFLEHTNTRLCSKIGDLLDKREQFYSRKTRTLFCNTIISSQKTPCISV